MKEEGYSALDHLFDRAERRQLQLAFSAWNVGEFLGVLDQRHRRGDLNDEAFTSALANFADEVPSLIRTGSLQVLPVSELVLTESWNILQQEHIYEADALQIATCRNSACELFISADGGLLQVAKHQGLKGLNPEKDAERVKAV